MSLLSGLFTELEKVPAPRFAVRENVARPEAPAKYLEQQQRPNGKRPPECRNQHSVLEAARPSDHAPPQLEAMPTKARHFIQTAATPSPEWLAARDAIYHHLMLCRSCYAPTGRHCPAGAELRQRYDQTPMVNDGKRDASPRRSRAQ